MPVSATSSPSGFTTGATFTRRTPRLYSNMTNTNDNMTNNNSSNPSVLISRATSTTSTTNYTINTTSIVNNNIVTNTTGPSTPPPSTTIYNTQPVTNQHGKTCLGCNSTYPFRTCQKHLSSSSSSSSIKNNKNNHSNCIRTTTTTTSKGSHMKDINNNNNATTMVLLNDRNHSYEYDYYDTEEEEEEDDDDDSTCDLLDGPGINSANQQQQRVILLSNRKEDERWVNLSNYRIKSGRMGHLHSCSQFIGVQKGAASNYDVTVDIQNVDLENDVLCGYLHVTGLTTFPPKITTFFEGEIIGHKHSFLTRKWHADLSVDSKHWKRFPSFSPFTDTFNDDGFSYDPSNQDFIYMRWKERFLVPNHHVNSIDGASYAGFYYICYQRSTNCINGFYYCRNNIEWYQELILSHVPQRQFDCFEFR